MEISKKEWTIEQQHLDTTLEAIESQLVDGDDKVIMYRNNIIGAQKEMWADRKLETNPSGDLEGAAIAWQHQSYMMMESKSMTFYVEQTKRLRKMAESAYFARIDFKEENEKLETLYIGITKLSGNSFANILVYDWRSPICSMFYNHDVGKAYYDCPIGTISGDLTLKRQYKIQKNMINYMFDSSLKIDDEILQEILGKNTDDRMKTIVTSIQREQNLLIRDEQHQLLIIQGSAGSGKTSIALHRIAYILYSQRETLNASQMVIFSPNEIFSDYISDVLPELGEENVTRTTFNDYMETRIDRDVTMEDWNAQMEYILTSGLRHGSTRKKSIAFKTSEDFVDILRRYVIYIKNEGLEFKDVYFKDTLIISLSDLKKLYRSNQEMLSPKKSLNRIRIRLLKKLDALIVEERKKLQDKYTDGEEIIFEEEQDERVANELNEVFREVRQHIIDVTRFDILYVYRRLYMDHQMYKKLGYDHNIISGDVANYTLKHLSNQMLLYEDALSITYIKGALEGVFQENAIKHVVIDEAQDYSFLHYEIFNQMFPKAGFTLLGDLNQSINPYLNIGKYDSIKTIFQRPRMEQVTLQRSYRSTRQISSFCSSLLNKEDHTQYLDREGREPKVYQGTSTAELMKTLVADIEALKAMGYQSIAIICKTEKESKKVYKHIESDQNISLMTRKDIHYKKGIVVVPSYLSKGLEFDAVLVCCHDYNNYTFEEERNLFYTVCSRALHELAIYCKEELPLFLRENKGIQEKK